MTTEVTSSVPFFTPSGIDPKAVSENPWELLINMAPTASGWEQRPGSELVHTPDYRFKAKASWSMNVDGHQIAFALGERLSTNGVVLQAVADSGRILFDNTLPMAAETIDFESWSQLEFVASTELNGRVFFASKVTNAPCIALDHYGLANRTWVYLNNNRQLWIGNVNWRNGANSSNYPYVTGQFGGRVVCAHLGRLFYAGFERDQKVYYASDIPTDQGYVPPSIVTPELTTVLQIDEQCLMWTDPNDPFAIGLPNLRQLPSPHSIVAMTSWQNILFIWTSQETWVMTGMVDEEFTLRKVADIGCANVVSFATTPVGVLFANDNGIYYSDGQRSLRLSNDIDHLFDRGFEAPLARANVIDKEVDDCGLPLQLVPRFGKAAYLSSRNEVWFPVQSTYNSDYYKALVYSFDHKGWWVASAERSYENVRTTSNAAGWAGGYRHILPVGGDVYTIGYDELAATDVIHKMAWGGGVQATIKSSGYAGKEDIPARWKSPFCMISKPLLVNRSPESFVEKVRLLFRELPDGMTCDQDGIHTPQDAETGITVKQPTGVGAAFNIVFAAGTIFNTLADMCAEIQSQLEGNYGAGTWTVTKGTSRVTIATTGGNFDWTWSLPWDDKEYMGYAASVVNQASPWIGSTYGQPLGWGVANDTYVFLWGQEGPYDGMEQSVWGPMQPQPLWVYTPGVVPQYVWGIPIWNAGSSSGAGYLAYAPVSPQTMDFPLTVRSNFVRVAIWGFGCNRALLRGMELLVQNTGPAGGRD